MSTPNFLYDDKVIGATLTGSSETTGFPVENIQHPFKTKQWKTTGLTTESVIFNLGSAISIDTIAIINHNFNQFTTTAPTITIDSNSSNSFPNHADTLTINTTTNLVDYSLTNSGGSFQYWKLSMTGGAGLDTTYDIGRIMLGAKYQPAKSYDIGIERTLIDFTEHERSIGGQLHSDIKELFNRLTMSFSYISLTDRDAIVTMFDLVRTNKDIILTTDTTSTALINSNTYYGKFASMPTFANAIKTATDERYNVQLVLDESL